MDLVVFQHGSHGEFSDFTTVIEELQRSGREVEVWGSDACKWMGTDKGIEVVAATIAKELDEYLLPRLEEKTVRVCFVGHSMGGLIVRSLITKARCFEHPNLIPLLYMSIASPHLGIRQIGSVLLTFAYLIGKVYSQSYADLTQDSEVLTVLSDTKHIDALGKFKARATMVNTHDHLVSFGTAAIVTRKCKPKLHSGTKKGLKKTVLLEPTSIPSDEAILESFTRLSDTGNVRASRVVQQFKALRSLDWEMTAVDLAHRGKAAHADIIARPARRGKKSRNVEAGRFSAEYAAGRLIEAFEST